MRVGSDRHRDVLCLNRLPIVRNYRARLDVSTTESLLIDKSAAVNVDRAGNDGTGWRDACCGNQL